uniref:SMP1 n=1 Tax=Arundo donax TaxID=35708 RepID=A0A0A8YI95_ARUDO
MSHGPAVFASTFSVFIGVENFCTPIIPRLDVVWIRLPLPLMLQTMLL